MYSYASLSIMRVISITERTLDFRSFPCMTREVLSAWGVTFAGARKVLLPSFCRRPASVELNDAELAALRFSRRRLPSRTLMVRPC